MPQRRRLILAGAAIAPALVLITLRLAGWFGWFNKGTVRFAGIGEAGFGDPGIGDPGFGDPGLGLYSTTTHSGPDWSVSLLILAATLTVIGAAAYFGTSGLDARDGAIGAFVIGWGACALAAAGGEVVLREVSDSTALYGFNWLAYAPLTGEIMIGSATLSYGYGILLGWLVGLAMTFAFKRTSPKRLPSQGENHPDSSQPRQNRT